MHEIFIPLSTITFQIPDSSDVGTEGHATGADSGGTETAAPKEDPGFMGSLPFLLMIGAFFWFVMIAPERKRRKKHTAMLAEMGKGDEVLTNGGLYGKVIKIQDQVATLEISHGVHVRYSLQAIQGVVTGEPKDGEKA